MTRAFLAKTTTEKEKEKLADDHNANDDTDNNAILKTMSNEEIKQPS